MPLSVAGWQDIVSIRPGRRLWWRWVAIEVRRDDTRLLLYRGVGGLVMAEWQRHTGRSAA